MTKWRPAAERGPDLDESLRARVLDLKSRMVELEALEQDAFQVAADAVAVAAGGDQHVGGQRGEAGRDRPDVEVVDLHDAVGRRQRMTDLVGVDAGRSLLEQDRERLPQDPPRAGEDEQA